MSENDPETGTDGHDDVSASQRKGALMKVGYSKTKPNQITNAVVLAMAAPSIPCSENEPCVHADVDADGDQSVDQIQHGVTGIGQNGPGGCRDHIDGLPSIRIHRAVVPLW